MSFLYYILMNCFEFVKWRISKYNYQIKYIEFTQKCLGIKIRVFSFQMAMPPLLIKNKRSTSRFNGFKNKTKLEISYATIIFFWCYESPETDPNDRIKNIISTIPVSTHAHFSWKVIIGASPKKRQKLGQWSTARLIYSRHHDLFYV